MEETTNPAISIPAADLLTEILRKGARQLLAQAIEAEVDDWVKSHEQLKQPDGRRSVVRNGYHNERTITTNVGEIEVRQPRVLDRRPPEEAEKFCSRILPPYLRKTKTLEEFIPWLYLKGVSTGGFSEALASLLGPETPGLSASTVTRLKSVWEDEYNAWNQRSFEGKEYVYVWADGIHFNIRLEEDRQCILVLMGATADGVKELIAVNDGHRESEESWKGLLLDCKARGLSISPKIATGDGALGFWKALRQVFPTTREQRCWVHKMANVLDKLPKRLQPQAKNLLHQIWMASKRGEAQQAFDLFLKTYEVKHPKATDCLAKDRDELLTYYDFPAQHWAHLRTTNPIESTFATVRLRTKRTKGCGSRVACLTMVFKLAQVAGKGWRALRSSELIADVIRGVPFEDGIRPIQDAA